MAQVIGFLAPTEEICISFLSFSLGPGRINQKIEHSLSTSPIKKKIMYFCLKIFHIFNNDIILLELYFMKLEQTKRDKYTRCYCNQLKALPSGYFTHCGLLAPFSKWEHLGLMEARYIPKVLWDKAPDFQRYAAFVSFHDTPKHRHFIAEWFVHVFSKNTTVT